MGALSFKYIILRRKLLLPNEKPMQKYDMKKIEMFWETVVLHVPFATLKKKVSVKQTLHSTQ